jgi:hypothetical protein
MADSHTIRSYQRIFRPDRRIYQIDGRRLPLPGGVPLEWLGWAFAALVAVLGLSQGSMLLAVALAGIGGALGASSHGWRGGVVAASVGFLVTLIAGVLLGWLDWPLRLLVVPGRRLRMADRLTATSPLGSRFRRAPRDDRWRRRSPPTARPRSGRRRCGSPQINTFPFFTTDGSEARRDSSSLTRSSRFPAVAGSSSAALRGTACDAASASPKS